MSKFKPDTFVNADGDIRVTQRGIRIATDSDYIELTPALADRFVKDLAEAVKLWKEHYEQRPTIEQPKPKPKNPQE